MCFRFTTAVVLWALVVVDFSRQADDVTTIANDFWEYQLKTNPSYATYNSRYDYNDLMKSYDIELFNTSRTEMEGFLQRMRAIDVQGLGKTDRVNYDILTDSIQTFLDGNLWALYGALSPITFLDGIQLFGGPGIASTSTRGDFENYIARLHAVQRQVDEMKILSRKAIELGRTLHNVSIVKVPDQIDRILFDMPENSSYFNPFVDKLNKSFIPEDVRVDIRSRGRIAVNAYMDAFRDLKNFIVNEYMSHTRSEYGVYQWDSSNNYYKACLKWHLSFSMSPEEVHQEGLDEVNRISGEMEKIMERLGFRGTVREFFDSLQGDGRFYSNDTDVILKAYNSTVFERIQPKLQDYFKDIPVVPLKIEASHYDGLGGGYSSDSNTGYFSINLFRPMEVPFFEMMALSLHEALPGHHLQQSYSATANLPDFRKDPILSFYNVPNWVPFYSAYMEGWGLYSEYLGEEMGLYRDDYELMGRYSYEILRAVRLVVDTGLHYYKWSREEAIEFMTNHTASAPGSAANEIDRYITWPGQACAYKVGEIKIKELKRNAENELGKLFNIKDFHLVLLQNGGMPLSVLETMVTDWIAEVKNTPRMTSTSQHQSVSSSALILVIINVFWIHFNNH